MLSYAHPFLKAGSKTAGAVCFLGLTFDTRAPGMLSLKRVCWLSCDMKDTETPEKACFSYPFYPFLKLSLLWV